MKIEFATVVIFAVPPRAPQPFPNCRAGSRLSTMIASLSRGRVSDGTYCIRSNQKVCCFITVAFKVMTWGPSTKSSCSQNTQLFSANGNGVVFPMLILSTKHSQVGSRTPESLRRLLEPVTITRVPSQEMVQYSFRGAFFGRARATAIALTTESKRKTGIGLCAMQSALVRRAKIS